jgi:hypothetical protein
MTLERPCRACGQPFDVTRADLLRGPATRCPACRDADTPENTGAGHPMRSRTPHALGEPSWMAGDLMDGGTPHERRRTP